MKNLKLTVEPLYKMTENVLKTMHVATFEIEGKIK